MKNKILLCCFPGDFSGVPIYSKCIINALSVEFDFTVITSVKGSVFNGVSANIVEVLDLKNSLMPNKIITNLMILFHVIRKVKPDIVHLNGTMFGLIGRILSLFLNEIASLGKQGVFFNRAGMGPFPNFILKNSKYWIGHFLTLKFFFLDNNSYSSLVCKCGNI